MSSHTDIDFWIALYPMIYNNWKPVWRLTFNSEMIQVKKKKPLGLQRRVVAKRFLMFLHRNSILCSSLWDGNGKFIDCLNAVLILYYSVYPFCWELYVKHLVAWSLFFSFLHFHNACAWLGILRTKLSHAVWLLSFLRGRHSWYYM